CHCAPFWTLLNTERTATPFRISNSAGLGWWQAEGLPDEPHLDLHGRIRGVVTAVERPQPGQRGRPRLLAGQPDPGLVRRDQGLGRSRDRQRERDPAQLAVELELGGRLGAELGLSRGQVMAGLVLVAVDLVVQPFV